VPARACGDGANLAGSCGPLGGIAPDPTFSEQLSQFCAGIWVEARDFLANLKDVGSGSYATFA